MALPFVRGKQPPAQRPSGATPIATPEPSSAIPSADGEAALDTLGAVLRALGSHAFDLAEQDALSIRAMFERWSQHILVAAPLSGSSSEEPVADEATPRRDWAAVRQLVVLHRKREAAHVVASIGNLREAIWSFVEIVNRAVAQDTQDGVLAHERLARLRAALDCKDVHTLRREVSQTASVIETALVEQQKRQQQRIAEFAASVRSLGEQLEGARREGTLDPMTRLPNRACFDEFLARTVKLTTLVGRSVALLMIDVDQFKTVNDTLGHQAGDTTIKGVADGLTRIFPRRGDLVARYGGDEFAIVLRDTPPKDARLLAQRLVDGVRALKITHQGREIRVTASVGMALCAPEDTPESWLARADAALYQAKAAGRDRWAEKAAKSAAVSATP